VNWGPTALNIDVLANPGANPWRNATNPVNTNPATSSLRSWRHMASAYIEVLRPRIYLQATSCACTVSLILRKQDTGRPNEWAALRRH
jgi:hypothetical protein